MTDDSLGRLSHYQEQCTDAPHDGSSFISPPRQSNRCAQDGRAPRSGARPSKPQQARKEKGGEYFPNALNYFIPLRPGWPRADTMNKPPHNPGVRELVQAGRQDHYRQTREDGLRGFRGWHERGYLPHFDAPGRTQFVTFRLADSFPESRRSEWEALFKLEVDRERLKQLESYLDRGHGEACLRRPDVAKLVGLKTSSTLSFSNVWTSVTNVPAVRDFQFSLTNYFDGQVGFFRLRKP